LFELFVCVKRAWRCHVLLICCQSQEAEDLSMISVQLVSKFLFNIGFHTKKILRWVWDPLWYDSLTVTLSYNEPRQSFRRPLLF